ncbi:hypothetical protein V2J94_17320 [Streptomyces sp. DSM 41524]|uniref:Transposase n=1 Tax=Streptomyces asiaticus subsp. ignotus TaxID=3098222 RepID=A0ABU7PZL6_9ACTN|nr:hypothetical protein [Streptomyces sp. DSM 41524]
MHRLRRILVHSTAVAAGQRRARQKRLAGDGEEMDKLAGAAGGRHYKTREKVIARAGVIAAKRRVTACLRWSITTDEHGAPSLAWHFDQDVLNAEAAVDGWYALLTSIPADQADPAQVLIHYKARARSSADTTTSKAPSRSRRSSCSTTGASPP